MRNLKKPVAKLNQRLKFNETFYLVGVSVYLTFSATGEINETGFVY